MNRLHYAKDIKYFIISDIFGKTVALDKLADDLDLDIDIIDPYAGKDMQFNSEEQAYHFFMSNVGLDCYCDIVKHRLDTAQMQLVLIAFSVGASSAWKISATFAPEKVKRLFCFYGSQVRYSLTIEPVVPIEYIMPCRESGFSVAELSSRLSEKQNVLVHETPYLHGFMNAFSRNYNSMGYTQYVNWLREQIIA
ncbi:MAG: hypothetical protein HQK65_17955 [Desulfamplus sp.]|nr:hypothetical protein [Desulfamplus sp.]